jgi:hypothetical protein
VTTLIAGLALQKIRRSLEQLGYEQPEVVPFGTAQGIMLRLPIRKDVAGWGTSATVFNALCAAESGTPKPAQQTTHNGESVTRTSCVGAAGAEAVRSRYRAKPRLAQASTLVAFLQRCLTAQCRRVDVSLPWHPPSTSRQHATATLLISSTPSKPVARLPRSPGGARPVNRSTE